MKNIKSKKTLGVLYILGSAFFFSAMALCVRIAGDLPVFEKMFFRNVVALVFSFVLVCKDVKSFFIARENRKYVFFRAFVGTLGVLGNFYAVDHMNIADASILNKLAPFFAMIASFFILNERPKAFDWIITVFAFIGAVFVIKPSFDISVIPAVVAVMGGLTAGIAYTFVRKATSKGVPGDLVIFYFSLFSTLVSGLFMLSNFKVMNPQQFCILMGAGLCGMGGQICITKAYTYAPAREIGTFDYTHVIYSAIMGFIFLQQIPDFYSIIGYVIIISMAILKWIYNNKQAERKVKDYEESN